MRWRVEGMALGGGSGTCSSALALRIEWAAQRASSIDGDAATPVRKSRDGVAGDGAGGPTRGKGSEGVDGVNERMAWIPGVIGRRELAPHWRWATT